VENFIGTDITKLLVGSLSLLPRHFANRDVGRRLSGPRNVSQASEQTIMAIAGHLTRVMLEHYNHIRMAAKRTALQGIVLQAGVNQNVNQQQAAEIAPPAIQQKRMVGLD
jgi:hypothetical protein